MSHSIHYVKLDECAGRLKSLSSVKRIAEALGQAATQAPQPMQVVASIARMNRDYLEANGQPPSACYGRPVSALRTRTSISSTRARRASPVTKQSAALTIAQARCSASGVRSR